MAKLEEKKEKIASKMASRRSEEKPVTKRDHKLSIKHLKDSIQFNKDHAKEHIKHMKEDKKLIKEREKSEKNCEY